MNTYGGVYEAGKALKSDTGWKPEPGDPCKGNNKSRFNAIPGGSLNDIGFFTDGRAYAIWWTATPKRDYEYASVFGLNWKNCWVGRTEDPKNYGYSVRCVKDSN